MTAAIVWFRRDLRLADNPALRHALEHHERVLPVYIHAPDEEAPWAPGGAARWWLHHSLEALSAALSKAGAPLLLRQGASLRQLRELARTVDASAVYWNRLYEPALIARDQAIKQSLRDDGLMAESFNAALLVEPWQLKTGNGDPYRVFTPYWRNASARLPQHPPPLPAVRKLSPVAVAPEGLTLKALGLLPDIRWDGGLRETWAPGEAGAWKRLEQYCDEAAAHYKEERDLPAVEATSRLSPHLHFGEISPGQIVARLRRVAAEDTRHGVAANVDHYIRELGWREFSHHLLYHYPHTPLQPLNPKFAAFPWRKPRDYAADLRAWQRGRTGVPIVDAGMRQLWHTGWMHNRVRMIVASFLTKNLLIPWQEGARWFWDTLVDADLANNTQGWQWIAGSGADAAPYFRVFNPVLQSGKFDGRGVYLRHWVPELKTLPDAALHAPWLAKIAAPAPYDQPLVDLAGSRERALLAYADIKNN
ncbi:MAG: deoxyribodipyrimidine photo-lyase [Nevskia sp.]|nr:deoxyribodipyrimidine photo-lyase [Nevskia sp.]